MKYKAVIFDLDGTLINTLHDLAYSTNAVLKEYAYPVHPIKAYRMMVGNGIRKLVERALPPDAPVRLIDEALEKFKAIYAEHSLDRTVPYEGIDDMLTELKRRNIPLAICTNKHDEAAKKIVAKLFPSNTFKEIIGDLPDLKRKPDPQKVLMLAQHLQVKPEETAYLGDSSVDMQTAVNAKMLPIGVLWGFRSGKELKDNGAVHLLQKPADLFSAVTFA